MTTWTFFGVVHPQRVPLTWPPIEGDSHNPVVNFDFHFRVIIHLSQVIVDIECKNTAPNDYTLRNIAADCASNLTDISAWHSGGYFSVEIISGIEQGTKRWVSFGNNIPVIANSRTDADEAERSLPSDLVIAVMGDTTNCAGRFSEGHARFSRDGVLLLSRGGSDDARDEAKSRWPSQRRRLGAIQRRTAARSVRVRFREKPCRRGAARKGKSNH